MYYFTKLDSTVAVSGGTPVLIHSYLEELSSYIHPKYSFVQVVSIVMCPLPCTFEWNLALLSKQKLQEDFLLFPTPNKFIFFILSLYSCILNRINKI